MDNRPNICFDLEGTPPPADFFSRVSKDLFLPEDTIAQYEKARAEFLLAPYGGTKTGRYSSIGANAVEQMAATMKALEPLEANPKHYEDLGPTVDVEAAGNQRYEALKFEPEIRPGFCPRGAEYNGCLFDPKQYREVHRKLVRDLPDLMRETGADFIAVRGISGAAVAFALQTVLDIHVVLVRKGENTHGQHIEGPSKRLHKYLILDDFVCSGETVRAIKRDLEKKATVQHGTVECVGIVAYSNAFSHSAAGNCITKGSAYGVNLPLWEYS